MGRRRQRPGGERSRRARPVTIANEPLIPVQPSGPAVPTMAPSGPVIAPPGTVIGPPVIPGPILVPPGVPTPERPSHHFRILRPSDLVVLDVRGYDLRLADPDADPATPVDKLHRLVADGDDARLEVGFTFQHLLEEAEPEQPIPPPPTPVPIPALAANGSRLVYAVGSDDAIVFTIDGVLDAMRRLPLLVVPLALPRRTPSRFTPRAFPGFVDAVLLPGGVRLVRTDLGLVFAPPGRGRTPTAASPRGLIRSAIALRTARTMLANERGIDLTGAVGDARLPGPGSLVFRPPRVRPIRQKPRAPRLAETAIEAPFRLILSPSDQGGFTHRLDPASIAPDPDRIRDPERVELWHTRLGVRRVDQDGVVTVDEISDTQRVVRAIWSRDMDVPAPPTVPFRASLDGGHREAIVRQSADPTITTPEPVDADKLYLSSIGAWLDLHGRWDDEPYRNAGVTPVLLAWDHEAAAGRDNYVRVVEPYYLFPFGHLANLVTITERKIIDVTNPQARLYQRKFLTLREPVRTYGDRQMPFTQVRIRPLVTPNLDVSPVLTATGFTGDEVFWPTIAGKKFEFVLDCLDHDGRRVVVSAALLAVSRSIQSAEFAAVENAYATATDRAIDAAGQSIAMAVSYVPGDTAFEAQQLKFLGTAELGRSTPRLENAAIVVPAMRHLAPKASLVTVEYATPYLNEGFVGANTAAQVLLSLATPTKVEFGNTDQSGGFVQPDLPVEGLSRAIGLVGDIASVTNPTPGADLFDPSAFLDGVLPKLFGLFELTDILAKAGLDAAPSFVTDQLDKIAALLADADDLVATVERAVQRLDADSLGLPTQPLRDQATAALTALQAIETTVNTTIDALTTAIDDLLDLDAPSDLPDVVAAVSDLLDDLAAVVTDIQQLVAALPLPPSTKAELERLVGALAPLLDAAELATTIEAIAEFVNGIDPAGLSIRAKYEWRPVLTNFPDGPAADALFIVPSDGFLLSIEARASGSDGVGVDVLAELRDFELNLFPGAPLIKLGFDRLAFRAASGRKPEVDVVFGGIEWQGILGFIQTLQELIPFDGFSDPPYVDVSADGITAGFDLALPNVAVGVFSLENISLGADVRIPFLGDAVTVGFNFCTREKPFRLTVMAIGGGGFVGIRLSPKGLVMLEMSLEAGASLSVNLGVASGSVSVMVGVYMRLEGEDGSLTGYFRIRGEVDVLGLISASITLELSLTYEFGSGKLVGRASITVEVEVLFFSASVEISVERRLAGSSGDPTLAQILGISEDGTPLTDVPAAWADYCGAFAGA